MDEFVLANALCSSVVNVRRLEILKSQILSFVLVKA